MLKFFERKNTETKELTELRNQLLDDLDFVSDRLERIRESYDMTAEPELVESLIYEERAMRSRYDYLIRVAKENNIKCKIGLRK
ncbi:MAG: DUF2508 family protein [Oscillospiraceae bacterium]|nr:DUF2508 family protein [Oscillospiraceae bacterium]